MAFPMASMGTIEMDSILVPEYPAITEEPKVLTTDCTSRIPSWTMDC